MSNVNNKAKSLLFLCRLFSSWLLHSSSLFGSRLFRRSLGGSRLFGSSLFGRSFSSNSLLGSWLFRSRFFGRRLLCCSRLFNSLLGSRFFSSSLLFSSFRAFSFFGSWLLSCFRLLCNRLLDLGNFGLLDLLGLFSKLVAASSLLTSSRRHLEGFSSYTLLQSCSHMYSSFGSINLIISTDVLQDSLSRAASPVLQCLDTVCNHD